MGASVRILCVEDEADIRAIIAMAFKLDSGFDVRIASSAYDALAILGDSEWIPDIVITDLLMPGMTGTDLLATIKQDKNISHLPVIFMTASNWANKGDAYLKAGAVAVIGKPFDPLRLTQTVRGILSSIA